ncbi:hypothetical protein N8198_00575 [Gammaproteobacteria bacterium]|nr:hypothetical protein [Gammaproteobacteria bacterium]
MPNLAMQDITFSACGNTKAKIEERVVREVVLVEGVQIVQAGVLRIMELQEQGYAYLRPWPAAKAAGRMHSALLV